MANEFPKIIWRYWHQGWDNSPFAVKYCSESVRHYAPDWQIIDLDSKNVGKYIDLPEVLLKIENFPLQTLSDLIRIRLLEKYGGVWVDATLFLNKSFTDFMMPLMISNFFCFFRHENLVSMSSWFLAAKKGSYVSRTMATEFESLITSNEFIDKNRNYFDSWRGSPDYFSFHRLFEKLIKSDNNFYMELNKMPYVSSYPVMSSIYYGWNKDVSLEHMTNILHSAPMLKVSHAVKEKDYNGNSSLAFCIKKMHSEYLTDFPHLHISSGLRTTELFNSFVNNPSIVGKWAGQFESQRDLRLCKDRYPHYHVYNFASTSGQHGAQLLIPHDSNRIFLRFQKTNGYSETREVAFLDDLTKSGKDNPLRDFEKRLMRVEKRVYPLKRLWRHIKAFLGLD